MPLLSRRPPRHVPRHSTREPFRPWDAAAAAAGPGGQAPTDVLESVLEALDGLDARERETV
ncbi:hypothetical protein AB2L27_03045 [Kineococcus sp. LSe6-4]|uniref:Uncharacterized protein n=1 Tax=Kineococcus halophytocola TaxID=3234027 RepID=A0ABV4GWQ5_9ACTN